MADLGHLNIRLIHPFVLLSASCAMALIMAIPARAASQGSLDATSAGAVTIRASIPARTNVSGLIDIAFTDQDHASRHPGDQSLCMWSNTLSRTSTITASGSGAGGSFLLTNGYESIAYSVSWEAPRGQDGRSILLAGVGSPAFITSATQGDCNSNAGQSASLRVQIESGHPQRMEAAVDYTGVLTLMVAPQ